MLNFKQFLFETKTFAIAPHGGGSWVSVSGDKKDSVSNHPTNKTVGNEPFKDTGYFRRPKIKKYIGGIRRSASQGKSLPPVSGTPHPETPEHTSIIDGNHRLRGYKNARTASVPVERIPHERVRLLHPEHKELETHEKTVMQGTPLSKFRNSDGSYDMDKPRKELGGLTIRHYFVKIDGTHNFKSPGE